MWQKDGIGSIFHGLLSYPWVNRNDIYTSLMCPGSKTIYPNSHISHNSFMDLTISETKQKNGEDMSSREALFPANVWKETVWDKEKLFFNKLTPRSRIIRLVIFQIWNLFMFFLLLKSILKNTTNNEMSTEESLHNLILKNWRGNLSDWVYACVHVCVLLDHLCPTLCNPIDCSPPGSSVHGDTPGKNTWVGWSPSPGDLPNPGIKPRSPALQADSLLSELPGI